VTWTGRPAGGCGEPPIYAEAFIRRRKDSRILALWFSARSTTPDSRDPIRLRTRSAGRSRLPVLADAPGYSNTDLTLAKRFHMGAERYLEFSVDPPRLPARFAGMNPAGLG